MSTRKVARRPEPRLVSIDITEGDFTGWACRARVDFPAAWYLDLQSGDVGRIMAVLDRIIVEHNFPGVDDELAATMADVDPSTGLNVIVDELGEAMRRLPPR